MSDTVVYECRLGVVIRSHSLLLNLLLEVWKGSEGSGKLLPPLQFWRIALCVRVGERDESYGRLGRRQGDLNEEEVRGRKFTLWILRFVTCGMRREKII